jgi:hypothetical protein
MAFQDRVDAGRQVRHTLGHLCNRDVLAWREPLGRHGRWSPGGRQSNVDSIRSPRWGCGWRPRLSDWPAYG